MALPSQSGRPTTTTGRIYSSGRRRRRRNNGLPVLLVGVAAAGLGIYGLLWAFRSVNTPDGPGAGQPTPAAADGSGSRTDELRQLGDPLGLARQDSRQPSTPVQTPPPKPQADMPMARDGSADAGGTGVEKVRRNVLREGIKQTLVESPEAGQREEVLATDGGGALPDKAPPAQPAAPAGVLARMADVDRLLAQNDKLGARQLLNEMLRDAASREADRAIIRTRLAELNEDLVFGPRVVAGDPMCELYEVQPGDRLSKIAEKRELAVHWKLIQRVNRLKDPNRIQLGQKLKLVRGPFHAVVDKSEYRMDIFQGAPGSPESWTYIRSFSVGLGRDDGTPLGTFVIARNSKVENPAWVNPLNSQERYARDDPNNPIGEFWLGLEGQGSAASYAGYGLHGTIEPDSIGEQRSLGCVRLLPDDIALVYELLEEGISVVKIVP
ncbi:MAG: hypothetical protein Kow0022_04730 [Phycisphaerales bacterium]